MPTWRWLRFEELAAAQLYEVLALRQAVFVVEQRCVYLDADGRDQTAWHLLGLRGDMLAAYLRVLPPGPDQAGPAIGRVLTHPAARGGGLGRALMAEGLQRTRALFPGQPVRLAAQQHLVPFYASLGFAPAGPPYDEDGIAHVDMLLPA